MNYSKFKKIKHIEKRLLKSLGALSEKRVILKINNYPDFDLTVYDKHSINTLFFKHEWKFDDDFKSVLNAYIDNIKVFHHDDLVRLSSEYKVDYDEEEELFLNELNEVCDDLMHNEGHEPNFDGFKLNSLNIAVIDNIKKQLVFSGAYEGDSSSIEPLDWNIFAECYFVGISNNEGNGYFYQELLSEAYSQKLASDFKLSYFIVFSALENYINEKMDTHETKERLKDIINRLFKNLSTPVNNNLVYTSIIGDFSNFEDLRNKIAHGRQKVTITESKLEDFILFTLILISSAEGNGSTFKEIAHNA